MGFMQGKKEKVESGANLKGKLTNGTRTINSPCKRRGHSLFRRFTFSVSVKRESGDAGEEGWGAAY